MSCSTQTRKYEDGEGSCLEEEGPDLSNSSCLNGSAVCLLDDDPSVLKATARLLSSAGREVRSFTDPRAFLSYAQEHHPRLLVLDITMPVMGGLEVQTNLRRISPASRIIILTSNDDPSVRSKTLSAGASAFFLKPAAPDEFLAAVESAFAASDN
ncbi:MAG: response regulator [Chthoniobacterales bacterium]